MKKRILSILLVIVMVIGLLPTVAQAAAGFSVTTKVLSGGGRLSYQNNLQSGQTVTLQPIPDQGYGVYSIEAEDRYHNRIQLTDLGNGCYTFTMPNCDVSVKVEFAKPVGYVDFLSNGKFTLEMGKTLDLKDKIYFSPVVYLPTRLTWSSDNNSVATVDSDGNVTAVGEGVANITVTAIDGTKTNGVSPSGSCKITVKKTSTITFDTDGGTTIAPITKAVGESFSVADPTKDGYIFAGWEPALPRYMPEENTNYTAQWTAKQYTITQDPNTINGTLFFAKDYNYDEPVTAAAQGDTIAVFWENAEGYVLDYETDISVRTEAGDAVEVESFGFTMPGDNVIVSASFVLEDYVIGVAASEGGKAEADKETAHMGDTVTVTATPDTGYVVKRVTVTPVYNNGPEPCSLEEEGGEEPEEIAVTDKGDGTHSFIMPASNVEVSVTFDVPIQSYDVWVGGEQFTNKKLTINGTTGTATYDPATNTLSLKNATITGHYNNSGIYSRNSLNIVFEGNNKIVASPDALNYGIWLNSSGTALNISGSGSLDVSGHYDGINVESGSVTISGGTVKATGTFSYGLKAAAATINGTLILAGGVSSGNMGLACSDVTFGSSAHVIIYDDAAKCAEFVTQPGWQRNSENISFSMEKVEDGSYFEYIGVGHATVIAADDGRTHTVSCGHITAFTENHSIGTDGKCVCGYVEAYDLWVGGEQFTSEKLTITDTNGGTATYNPDTNTLTLDNFSYSDDVGVEGIHSKAIDLNIKLSGVNTIITSGCSGILVEPNDAWSCGKLTINGTTKSDILNVTMKNGDTFAGAIDADYALYIQSCTVNVKSAADETFGIASGAGVIADAEINATGGWAGVFYGSVVEINNSEVTAIGLMEDDSAGLATFIGKIRINSNSTVKAEGDSQGIYSGILETNGATIISTGYQGIKSKDITISGGTVNASGDVCGIDVFYLTISEDADVNASGDEYGIYTEDITISSGTVTATATGEYGMGIFAEDGDFVISGGTVTAKAVGSGGMGIVADTLDISGGVIESCGDLVGITFKDDPTFEGNFGIYAGESAPGAFVTAPDDATYNNKYIKIIPVFTVKYMAGENEVHSETVAQGENVKNVPAVPAKTGYTGAWKADGKNITTDTIIYADYSVNQYTITFDTDGGSGIAAITQDYGTAVTAPAEPSKTGYSFSGWETAIPATMPAENMTVKAKWTINRYTVTYKADGEVVKTLTVEHGKDATAPEIPAKTGYTAAWSADGKNITADTEINAVYTINKYTVTYKADGKVVKTVEVEHGKDATAPEIPAKEGYNETTPKWDKDGKNITADTEINAVYTKNQPGEYADVTPDTNVGGGKVAEEIEELKEKVLFTQEEEKQIEYGADVEVWLEIKDISDSVSSEEKTKVEEKLGDADVALYLDIAMFKQVGENEASRLTQLSDKVQITFKLDDSYINTDKDVTRTYSIIHVHDGKAEVITPVFDANAKTLSFQTDRFSTYALVYTDVVNTPPTEETVPPTEKPAPPAEIPATGDSFQPAFWIACMTLSIFGIAVLLLDAKRRHAR